MIRQVVSNPSEGVSSHDSDVVVVQEDISPEELAAFHAQRERYERNMAWFQAHLDEVRRRGLGKCICVAGQELFVADTAQEVIALARAAHPGEDDGRFLMYIHPARGPRIYGHSPPMIILPESPPQPMVISYDPPE